MPLTSTLRSPAAQNLLAAAVAGVGVLVRPGRIPRWARRGLTAVNTAGTAGSLLMSNKDAENGGQLGLKPVQGARNTTASTGSALAAATGGLTLLTSGIGLKMDAKAEGYLLKKGVKHPRIWMAVGAVAIVFIVKTVQDAATKKAEDAAAKMAAAANDQPAAGAPVKSAAKPAVSRAAVGTTAADAKADSAQATTEPASQDASAAAAQEHDTPIWSDVTRSSRRDNASVESTTDAGAATEEAKDVNSAGDADDSASK